jgi:hypothetical protein
MDDTRNENADADPPQNDAGDQPREFDPEEVENDPSQNPPIPELKDLKGG